ncbi:hypothetical protein M404DRAFT_421601 [Pisolithus tinctorius Marx 270]|uniref:Uncharacterized protein n=1 Tax=Pisolithus tinctorius Marx 270 TaxID=870435 RepID=A0A0C3PFB7_PISTI|nr:hypothetical protein M404DRAFT_421601 [Pisolithus tinctorius Marx 270]
MGPRPQRYSEQSRLSGPSQSMCHGRRLCSISHISSPYGLRVDGPLVLAERARRFHSSERLLSMSPPMHDERIHHPMTEKLIGWVSVNYNIGHMGHTRGRLERAKAERASHTLGLPSMSSS